MARGVLRELHISRRKFGEASTDPHITVNQHLPKKKQIFQNAGTQED